MIFIEDNFFPEKEYIKICEEILNTNFVPPPKERRDGTEKGSGTPGGAYWFEKELTLNEKVIFLCEKLIKDKFNENIPGLSKQWWDKVEVHLHGGIHRGQVEFGIVDDEGEEEDHPFVSFNMFTSNQAFIYSNS